ncbi:formylmethanofuran dehydrogenase subunit C [Chelativorans composti]|uniref:Formylmethanofuran dehydrogenase subunit C n=1 Tax=Chelativorans composti TaxID=768533 RepID=A0ABW5DCA8_9HYPH|nr:formylmethanofuran dehydrogenase subunit C [bacterium SGD-2]
MSGLTFTLQQEPVQRLDLSALTPQGLAGKSVAEVEKIELCGGRNRVTVGDCFRVSGTVGEAIVFEGGSSRFDCIGAELAGGSIRVAGDAGALLGRRMSGGSIVVEGSAGALAGSQMTDGRIEIMGSAGELAGGPAAGEMRGMAGGTLVIRGRAGDRLGDRMRRGTIAALGGCGDYAGSRMIAGTILIKGGAGRLPGYLMRRGSILLDRAPAELSPTFVPTGPWFSAFASLLERELVKEGIIERPFFGQGPMRYAGDMAVPGKGELIISALAG